MPNQDTVKRGSPSSEDSVCRWTKEGTYKELYDRKGNLKMQSCFPCQCGKQIQIPHRSSRGQSFRCVGCGILYSFPQDSLPHNALFHESLSHESLSHESLSHEALSYEALSDEALSDEALSHEAKRGTSSRGSSSRGSSSRGSSSRGSSSRGSSSRGSSSRRSSSRGSSSRRASWGGKFSRRAYSLLEFFRRELLPRESVTWNKNGPESEIVAFKSEPTGDVLSSVYHSSLHPRASSFDFEPSGNFLSGATTQSPIPEKSFLRKVIPLVLGGLAALTFAIATMWYVFGRGIGGTGRMSQNVPRTVPQTLLADRLESTESIQSPVNIALGTAESIKMLRRLQDDLSDVPADKKDAMMAAYYGTARKLSKQLASLRGRSISRWRTALEDLATEILTDDNSKTVMQLGPIGKLPGINASSENDFVVTVVRIGELDRPDSSSLWVLNDPWILGEQQVSVQMLPGAWSTSTEMEPTNCLVFGRLVAIDSSNAESSTIDRSTLTLQVHAAMPEENPDSDSKALEGMFGNLSP
jgi:hypothetical protein